MSRRDGKWGRIVVIATTGLLFNCSNGDDRVLHRAGEPDMFHVSVADSQMKVAMDSARATLPEFEAVLRQAGDGISGQAVKVRLKTTESFEHIWLVAPALTPDSVSGIVGNVPVDVLKVEIGQRITVPRSSVSDWMYVRDRMLHGGYTVRVLMKGQTQREKQQILDALGVRY